MPNHEMKVEDVPTSSLVPNPENPRIIPDEAVAAVCRSLNQFGFQHPLVVRDDNVIVAGHTRHRAALTLGLDTVPVVRFNGTATQADGFMLADNRTGELSGWDHEQLAACLTALTAEDEDGIADDLGWTEEQLAALMDGEPPGDGPGDAGEEGFGDGPGEDPDATGGAPDGAGGGYKEQYGVIVLCDHEGHQRAVHDELVELGYNVRVVTT